mmetsp:Transcript_44213/g.116866  ORF Transcript_44213/g.116866 Transcript_44213/m.116866 type:complete len:389 (-) Transcript_44213:61-1227(-)
MRGGAAAAPHQLDDRAHDARDGPVGRDVHADAKRDARRQQVADARRDGRLRLEQRQCSAGRGEPAGERDRGRRQRREAMLHQDGHVLPHVRDRHLELFRRDAVRRRVELEGADGDDDGRARADELAVELRARRGAKQVARLEVLEQVACLHRAGLGERARDEVGDDVAGRDEGEDDLRELPHGGDGVDVRLPECTDGEHSDEARHGDGEDHMEHRQAEHGADDRDAQHDGRGEPAAPPRRRHALVPRSRLVVIAAARPGHAAASGEERLELADDDDAEGRDRLSEHQPHRDPQAPALRAVLPRLNLPARPAFAARHGPEQRPRREGAAEHREGRALPHDHALADVRERDAERPVPRLEHSEAAQPTEVKVGCGRRKEAESGDGERRCK